MTYTIDTSGTNATAYGTNAWAGNVALAIGQWAYSTDNYVWAPSKQSKRDQLRAKIHSQLRPKLTNHRGLGLRANGRGADFSKAKPNEIIALQLLRQMVAPEEFRRYLRYGFVNVQAPSGLSYQIQRKSHMVLVRDQGQWLASLCVYVADKVPPTDDVIAKILIAECDEPDLWVKANIQWGSHEGKQHPALVALGVVPKTRATTPAQGNVVAMDNYQATDNYQRIVA